MGHSPGQAASFLFSHTGGSNVFRQPCVWPTPQMRRSPPFSDGLSVSKAEPKFHLGSHLEQPQNFHFLVTVGRKF